MGIIIILIIGSQRAHKVSASQSVRHSVRHIAKQIHWWRFLHFDVGKEFLAGIFQAGPKEIYHIVDNQKAIVIALCGVYIYWRILLVITL